MKYNISIDQVRSLEWELNSNQAALMSVAVNLHQWAEEIVMNGKVFYYASRNKIIDEIPLFYSKPDTVYRNLCNLHEKGLIDYHKLGKKDLIRLTDKAKLWNSKSDSSDYSDIDSTNSDLDSNFGGENTNLNPTYNKTNINNRTNNNKPTKKFVKPTVEEIKSYCQERNNSIKAEQFFNYYEAKGWVVGKSPMKDWKAAIRTWEQNDINKNEPQKKQHRNLENYEFNK